MKASLKRAIKRTWPLHQLAVIRVKQPNSRNLSRGDENRRPAASYGLIILTRRASAGVPAQHDDSVCCTRRLQQRRSRARTTRLDDLSNSRTIRSRRRSGIRRFLRCYRDRNSPPESLRRVLTEDMSLPNRLIRGVKMQVVARNDDVPNQEAILERRNANSGKKLLRPMCSETLTMVQVVLYFSQLNRKLINFRVIRSISSNMISSLHFHAIIFNLLVSKKCMYILSKKKKRILDTSVSVNQNYFHDRKVTEQSTR